MSIQEDSHSRRSLLTGDWVLVSPQRTQRPWQGQLEPAETDQGPAYDRECYLCPGNPRANERLNPDYRGPFVFDNDFPALSRLSRVGDAGSPLFQTRPESGRCRVLCYTDCHNSRLATMTRDDIDIALRVMTDEFTALDRADGIGYVQIFENRGQMMGCSNQHPHAQIWATEHVPVEPAKELARQREWLAGHGTPLLGDYLAAEIEAGDRIVCSNEHFVTVVPWWAVWPFEMLVLPRRAFAAPDEMTGDEVRDLALTLKTVLSAYDRLFATSAPYSMGFHPRPSDDEEHPEWIFHAHIYPPLLRSATIRKHQVGFEMLGMPQRDLTPEAAALKLRQQVQ